MRTRKDCWCRRCDQAQVAATPEHARSLFNFVRIRMNLCPECGNKRCPKATQHDLACTGSNEPGQPGSDYAAVPEHISKSLSRLGLCDPHDA